MAWATGCADAASIDAASWRTPASSHRVGDHVDIGDDRAAMGQRAGLVDGHQAHPARLLEVRAALDQDPSPGRPAEPGDDGDRGRDDERARTGEDEEHERPVEPVAEAAEVEGDRERGGRDGDGEHDRRVDGGEAIDEALRRGPLGLRGLDRVGDAIERAGAAGGGDPGVDRAVLDDRAGEDEVTRHLLDRDALAGDRCLVDGGRPGDDHAVERDPLPRPHDDHRADGDVGGGDLDHAVGRSQAGGLGDERGQGADGVASALEAPRLDQLGEPEQPHDDRRLRPLPDRHRADDGDAHQQGHRQAASEQRPDALAEGVAPAEQDRGPGHDPHEDRLLVLPGEHGDLGADGEDPGHRRADDHASGQHARRADRVGDLVGSHPGLADGRRQRRGVVEGVGDGDATGHEIERQLVDATDRLERLAQLALLRGAVELGDAVGRHGARHWHHHMNDCSDVQGSPAGDGPQGRCRRCSADTSSKRRTWASSSE